MVDKNVLCMILFKIKKIGGDNYDLLWRKHTITIMALAHKFLKKPYISMDFLEKIRVRFRTFYKILGVDLVDVFEKSFTITNTETGEVIEWSSIKKTKAERGVTKMLVDKMLSEANTIEELDREMLYEWCKKTNQINNYGQICCLGAYRNRELEKKICEDITITGYTIRIISLAHDFSSMLMKNRQTFVQSWTELWETISCSNKTTRSKVKKFLLDNNIIRDVKVFDKKGAVVKRMVINPFLFRHSSYTSQVAIMCFQDCIKEGCNVSAYPIRFLQSVGIIEFKK